MNGKTSGPNGPTGANGLASALADATACERLLPLGAEDLDDRLEGEPLWDLLTGAEHLAELGARELLHLEALLLGLLGGDVLEVLVVTRAHEVERRHGLHAKLLAVQLGKVLRLEGAVEVLAVDR